jgi:hypothetical protein
VHNIKTYGEVKVWLHAFLTLALYGGRLLGSLRGHFTPRGGAPGTYSLGGRLGPRASMDTVEKRNLLPLPGIEPRFLAHPAHSLVTILFVQPSSKFVCVYIYNAITTEAEYYNTLNKMQILYSVEVPKHVPYF